MLPEGEAAIWRQVFDFWRQNYGDLPYSVHQNFYNLIAEIFPHQDKADRKLVEEALIYALSLTGHPLRVWELGGWDGALAKDMIAACADGICIWFNNEICKTVVEQSNRGDENPYFALSPNNWIWQYVPLQPGQYHIAILSHVIEHLSWEHLQALLNMLKDVPLLYIQTPSSLGQSPHPTLWYGTLSTHKLEVGMADVEDWIMKTGKQLIWRKANAVLYGHLRQSH